MDCVAGVRGLERGLYHQLLPHRSPEPGAPVSRPSARSQPAQQAGRPSWRPRITTLWERVRCGRASQAGPAGREKPTCAKTTLGPTVHPEVQASVHRGAGACVTRVPGGAGSEPAQRMPRPSGSPLQTARSRTHAGLAGFAASLHLPAREALRAVRHRFWGLWASRSSSLTLWFLPRKRLSS